MEFNEYKIKRNGQQEQLGGVEKHGVRKEHVDKCYHNLFDYYDKNQDGTLDSDEVGGVFTNLQDIAGEDKTVDEIENRYVGTVFESEVKIKDADFMGFVKSVSEASSKIQSSTTIQSPDGGKEVVTRYDDGVIETIAYYPDGEYKYKKVDQSTEEQTRYYTIGENVGKHYTPEEIEKAVKKAYNKEVAQIKKNNAQANAGQEGSKRLPQQAIPKYEAFKAAYLKEYNVNEGTDTKKIERHDFEVSKRAADELSLKDFVISHFVQTHKDTKAAIDTMGVFDKLGAKINDGAGELYTAAKNFYNKYYGEGTEEDYRSLAELLEQYKKDYAESQDAEKKITSLRNNPEQYFKSFEVDYRKATGKLYDAKQAEEFQDATSRYQMGQALSAKVEILDKLIGNLEEKARLTKVQQEIVEHKDDNLLSQMGSGQALGYTAEHLIDNGSALRSTLLEYFDGDEENVQLFMQGNNDDALATVKELKATTEATLKETLGGKSLAEAKSDYRKKYKETYGQEALADEITEKVMGAKETGGMVKLGAITAISIIVSKKVPSASMMRALVSKFGQTAVREGLKFAMASGTIATDVGLSLVNQMTSERGIELDEIKEGTKGTAKFIYASTYIAGPMAHAVSGALGKIGLAGKLFTGGTKVTQGAIQTTTISGEKLLTNLSKAGGKGWLATTGGFITEGVTFTGLEVATEGKELGEALTEQGEMLTKLKVMNHVIQYMLGGRAYTVAMKKSMDAAVELSGAKEWKIKEIKAPDKTIYEVDTGNGKVQRYESAEDMTTAFAEKISQCFKGDLPSDTQPEQQQAELKAETAPAPDTKVSDNNAKTETTDKAQPTISERIQTAQSREDFNAIREEINGMPRGEEKFKLFTEYQKKWREFSAEPHRSQIKMQYIPEGNGYKELSDTEFETLKTEIAEKLKAMPEYFKKRVKGIGLDKYNAQILNRILSDEKLSDNENVVTNARKLLAFTQNPESVEVANEILNNENTRNSKVVMQNISEFLENIDTPEQVLVAKEILSNENLFNNEEFMAQAKDIISATRNENQAKKKIAVLEKIATDETYYKDENFMKLAKVVINAEHPELAIATEGKETTQNSATVDLKTVDINSARNLISEAITNLNDWQKRDATESLLNMCKTDNDKVDLAMLNTVVTLLKDHETVSDVYEYLFVFNNGREGIDYQGLEKFNELLKENYQPNYISNLIKDSRDNTGKYNAEWFEKVFQIRNHSFRSSLVKDCATADNKIDENLWQKVLELKQLKLSNFEADRIMELAKIRPDSSSNETTFSNEIFDKAKKMITEEGFDNNNVATILEKVVIDGQLSESQLSKVEKLHGKISEDCIADIIRYNDEAVDFALKLKETYKFEKDSELSDIINQCLEKSSNYRHFNLEQLESTNLDKNLTAKVEELLGKYKVDEEQVAEMILASHDSNSMSSKRGTFDEKLYNEVIKLQQAGIKKIASVVDASSSSRFAENEEVHVNYDLLEKAQEWKKEGYKDNDIVEFLDAIESVNPELLNENLVERFYDLDLESDLTYMLRVANASKEMTSREFIEQVNNLHNATADGHRTLDIIKALTNSANYGADRKVSKEHLEKVTDMVRNGYNARDIVNISRDLKTGNVDNEKFELAYQLSQKRVPQVSIPDVLSKISEEGVSAEFKEALVDIAVAIKDKIPMYEIEQDPSFVKPVADALKAGVDFNTAKMLLATNFKQYQSSDIPSEEQTKIHNEVKTKLFNALIEHPENKEHIKNILRNISSTLVNGKTTTLDLALKYPEKSIEITNIFFGASRSRLNSRIQDIAANTLAQLDNAQIPIEKAIEYTKILYGNNTNKPVEFSPENISKITELHKLGQLDNAILSFFAELPHQSSKTGEIVSELVRLRSEGKLEEYNLSNTSYAAYNFVNCITKSAKINNEKTGELEIVDNYKEVLDFIGKYDKFLTDKNLVDIGALNLLKNFKQNSEGETANENIFDVSSLNKLLEYSQELGLNPEQITYLVSTNQTEAVNKFIAKINLEENGEVAKQYLETLCDRYECYKYSNLLDENISEKELNFILDIQKAINEKTPEGQEPHLLNGKDFAMFTEQGELSDESLNKLRFYIEQELEDPNVFTSSGYTFRLDNVGLKTYENLIQVYDKNPQAIEHIEHILFDRGFTNLDIDKLKTNFSSEPEVLQKQLELLDKTCKYVGDSSYENSRKREIITSMFNSYTTIEDMTSKLEMFDFIESKLQKASSGISQLKAKFTRTDKARHFFQVIKETNSDNMNFIKEVVEDKKLSLNLLMVKDTAQVVSKENETLLVDLIKNNIVTDWQDINTVASATHKQQSTADFIRENLNKIPKDKIGEIARIYNDYNGNLMIKLYNDKNWVDDPSTINKIAIKIRAFNADFAEKLCSDENIPHDTIPDIIAYVTPANLELTEKLCASKDFPKKYIANIISTVTSDNIKLVTDMCFDKTLNITPDNISSAMRTINLIKNDIRNLPLSNKIEVFETLSNASKDVKKMISKYSGVDVNSKIAELTTALGKKKDIVSISKEQQRSFVENILANNNQEAENILKNFDFKRYATEGLPLKYSRKAFNENVENIIKDLSAEEQSQILSHFGLVRGSAGFDGLPNNKPFEDKTASQIVKDVANKVKKEIEDFTTSNELMTGDYKADKVLNGLVNGLPEFTSIIGKQQHETHAYTVDIHTLKVLQSAMNNPIYETLPDNDKTILKIAAICHDFGKRGGVVDTDHAVSSAEYTTAILDKFPFPQRMKDRIIDIVDNHHWFEAYNTGKIEAKDVAVRCRRPEDFKIYEILAKADLENVNEDFHLTRSRVSNQADFDKFMHEKMADINKALDHIYQNANLIFDTQFVRNGENFPTESVEIAGEKTDLKVLNLNELKDSDSLTPYGFSTGVTKDNARFTVHMTAPEIGKLGSVAILTQNSLNHSAWSTSLIKANNNRTYSAQKFGFILDTDQANISEAYYQNLGSGCSKGLNQFRDILFSNYREIRTFIKDRFIKAMATKGITLSDEEYGQFAKQLLNKKYSTQINDDIIIGDKVLKAKDVIECLDISRDALFEGGNIHSEIVSINPRIKGMIAKVENIEDCPEEFLKFARDNNLPIILMKDKHE